MTPTHTLKLADGYGTTRCELLDTCGPLATVRVPVNSYWKAPVLRPYPARNRSGCIRMVRLADLTPLAGD